MLENAAGSGVWERAAFLYVLSVGIYGSGAGMWNYFRKPALNSWSVPSKLRK